MSLPPHSWDYGRAYSCILPRSFDKSATFFSLRLTFLYRTQVRQGLRSPVTNVVRTLRMYGAIPWIDSVFVACCLIKYRDFIFFYVTPRGGFCVVSTLLYRLTDSSIIAKKNICTREQPVTCSSVDLSCRSGRQTDRQGGAITLFDLIWFAQVTAVLRVPQEWPTDLKALSACLVSWFSVTHVVLIGIYKTFVSSCTYGSLSVLCVQLLSRCTAGNSVRTDL